jgi:hypothetical protein
VGTACRKEGSPDLLLDKKKNGSVIAAVLKHACALC